MRGWSLRLGSENSTLNVSEVEGAGGRSGLDDVLSSSVSLAGIGSKQAFAQRAKETNANT